MNTVQVGNRVRFASGWTAKVTSIAPKFFAAYRNGDFSTNVTKLYAHIDNSDYGFWIHLAKEQGIEVIE